MFVSAALRLTLDFSSGLRELLAFTGYTLIHSRLVYQRLRNHGLYTTSGTLQHLLTGTSGTARLHWIYAYPLTPRVPTTTHAHSHYTASGASATSLRYFQISVPPSIHQDLLPSSSRSLRYAFSTFRSQSGRLVHPSQRSTLLELATIPLEGAPVVISVTTVERASSRLRSFTSISLRDTFQVFVRIRLTHTFAHAKVRSSGVFKERPSLPPHCSFILHSYSN